MTKPIRITEAWKNRRQIIEACRDKDACETEYRKLTRARSRKSFDNVLLANFSWCVSRGILEQWLPKVLPDCVTLDCSYWPNLTHLPELPKGENIYIKNCRNLIHIPDLPNCIHLSCEGSAKLKKLPNLPKIKYLIYSHF